MSGGYCYGETEPTEPCPYCGTVCFADFVDVGVGFTQCGPFHCERCESSQIGPYDDRRELSDDEKRTGWYAPGAEPGSSANVINGKIVGHREALDTYRSAFTGNPLYETPGYVEEWWDKQRAKAGNTPEPPSC